MVAQLRDGGPDLTPEHQLGLELADVLMTDPAGVSDDLRERLGVHFSRGQIIELALDVMKWSYQKVPVALGLDTEVAPGELTDLVFDREGRWVPPG